MKSVGEYLKSLRLRSGQSLEQAALVTKVSKGTLRAIEEADTNELPAKSYLRGFVFSYGKFLGADMTHLKVLFQNELGSTNPEIKVEEISKTTWKPLPLLSKLQLNTKTFIICGLTALTVLAIFTQKVVQKYQSETVIQNNTPAKTLITEQQTKKAPAVTNIKIPEVLASVPSLIENKMTPEARTAKPETKALSAVAKVEANKLPVNKKTPQQIAPDSQLKKFSKELLIEAKQDTSIKIKIGENQEKMVKMLKGDFHTIKAKSNVMIEAVNYDDIQVIFNGTLQTHKNNKEKPKVLNF